MIELFTEEQAVAAVARLTRTRLVAFIKAEVVTPMQGDAGWVFRRLDIVRLELLCELSEEFDLAEDALAVVISLIDQLHAVRADLRAVSDAISQEPAEVRARIGAAVRKARSKA